MTKVLIVDDEPLVLHSTEALLSALGFETVAISDPAAVEETIRRERPHVVLQDVRMPGLDVELLVQRLNADPDLRATPVVLFSAGLDLRTLGARIPVAGVLEKPFKPAQAIEAIERAAER